MPQPSRYLDLPAKSFPPERGGDLGAEYLHGNSALVPNVFGEKDGGPSAGAQFAFEAIAVGEVARQAVEQVRHQSELYRSPCGGGRFSGKRARARDSISGGEGGGRREERLADWRWLLRFCCRRSGDAT